MRSEAEVAHRWQTAADEIQAEICERAVDERGVFTQHYETTALDASLLLLPLVRFLPVEDERIRNTVLAIAAEDNLVKGASGQALQNANLLLDLPETLGLPTVGLVP